MSAQYRVYRDQESVDGLEVASWSDNEPSTLQIYEKTTEDLPFSSINKKATLTKVAALITVGLLGFLLGYFAPFHRSGMPAVGLDNGESTTADHLDRSFDRPFEDSLDKEELLAKVNSESISNMFNKFKNTPRTPGSRQDSKFADHISKLFEQYGLDKTTTSNYTFTTMLPSKPTLVALKNKNGQVIFSNLVTDKYPNDDMRPFLPLSQANQTSILTDQLLFVNRGTKEDFSKLESLGVGMNESDGKVLVIRQSFYKAHDIITGAHAAGAKAILLFPDPDTFGDSSAFPRNVKLPQDAGRSQPIAWNNYGDLVSADHSPSIDTSKLPFDKEARIKVPVIPISFRTASAILRGLSGEPAPREWNCFDYTLHVGPGYKDNIEDGRKNLSIEFYNQETTLTSKTVTGTIIGASEPDRYVIVGSRRDSLNRGLLDSLSGTAVMLEIARVYGAMLRLGKRPKRTIVFNSFGSESLNLIGSSRWLDSHQRLLHFRAVAYINCDLVVTGNQSVSIAASPLLFQVLYNSTKQVTNPNKALNESQETLYDAWKWAHERVSTEVHEDHQLDDIELEKLIETYDIPESKLTKSALERDDGFGTPGSILQEYKRSALVKNRPRIRSLDLHSIYSPFFLYSGIPVVDVRFSGFLSTSSNNSQSDARILEETLPAIGTKYDNMNMVQLIDPNLKYHVAVAQTLSEILRGLSDSTFLPYNLIDYAVTLKECYNSLVVKYSVTLKQANLNLDGLKAIVHDFMNASIQFHHRQDLINPRDAMKIRGMNDQLILLERAFLDPSGIPSNWDRKHIILSPNDGQDHKEGFPGLVDWITLLGSNANPDPTEIAIFAEILAVHYRTILHTISSAIDTLEEVHSL